MNIIIHVISQQRLMGIFFSSPFNWTSLLPELAALIRAPYYLDALTARELGRTCKRELYFYSKQFDAAVGARSSGARLPILDGQYYIDRKYSPYGPEESLAKIVGCGGMVSYMTQMETVVKYNTLHYAFLSLSYLLTSERDWHALCVALKITDDEYMQLELFTVLCLSPRMNWLLGERAYATFRKYHDRSRPTLAKSFRWSRDSALARAFESGDLWLVREIAKSGAEYRYPIKVPNPPRQNAVIRFAVKQGWVRHIEHTDVGEAVVDVDAVDAPPFAK